MKDLVGEKFGRLRPMWPEGRKFGRKIVWLCLCDCGGLAHVLTESLYSGHTTSCGCIHKEQLSARRKTHGCCKTPEYRVYAGAKARCTSLNVKCWPDYGGRGIQFNFQSFEEFFAEVGPRPSRAHTIDRLDNDGHYEKGNVRWATRAEQRKNQRARSVPYQRNSNGTFQKGGMCQIPA